MHHCYIDRDQEARTFFADHPDRRYFWISRTELIERGRDGIRRVPVAPFPYALTDRCALAVLAYEAHIADLEERQHRERIRAAEMHLAELEAATAP
jgi:hypothetical protein